MNKEQRKEYQKNYRLENKETIKERKKIYRQANKQKISDYNRKHGNARVVCECGKTMNRSSLTNHRKRNAHIRLLKEKEEKNEEKLEEKLEEKKEENLEKEKLEKEKLNLQKQICEINQQLQNFNLNNGTDNSNNE